jgi:hypothetical protein
MRFTENVNISVSRESMAGEAPKACIGISFPEYLLDDFKLANLDKYRSVNGTEFPADKHEMLIGVAELVLFLAARQKPGGKVVSVNVQDVTDQKLLEP